MFSVDGEEQQSHIDMTVSTVILEWESALPAILAWKSGTKVLTHNQIALDPTGHFGRFGLSASRKQIQKRESTGDRNWVKSL